MMVASGVTSPWRTMAWPPISRVWAMPVMRDSEGSYLG